MAPIVVIVMSVLVAALRFNTVAGNPVEKRSWTAGQLPVLREGQHTCDLFNQSYCHCFSPTDRTHARFPNRRGQNAAEAKTEFGHFIRPDRNVIKNGCSDKIGTLLCFFYFPYCNPSGHENSNTVLQSEDYSLPCRSLCEEVRRDCENQFNSSFQWPVHLDCSTLPSNACISGRDPVQGYDACVRPTPTVPVPKATPTMQPPEMPTIIDVTPEPDRVCEPFDQPYCRCFNPDERTHALFPNHRNQTARAAEMEFQYFVQPGQNVIKNGCSDKIGTLLCFFYFPPCNPPTDNNVNTAATAHDREFLPCRQLCEYVHRDCAGTFTDHPQWQALDMHLDCSRLPTTNCISGSDPEQGYDACVNGFNVIKPREPEDPTDPVTPAPPPCDPGSCPTCSLRLNCNGGTFIKNNYTWAAHVRVQRFSGTGTVVNGNRAYLVQVMKQYLPDPGQGPVLNNIQIIQTTNPECCGNCPNNVETGGEYLFAGYHKTNPLVWYLEVKNHGGIVSQWSSKYQENLAMWIASALASIGNTANLPG